MKNKKTNWRGTGKCIVVFCILYFLVIPLGKVTVKWISSYRIVKISKVNAEIQGYKDKLNSFVLDRNEFNKCESPINPFDDTMQEIHKGQGDYDLVTNTKTYLTKKEFQDYWDKLWDWSQCNNKAFHHEEIQELHTLN